MGGAGYCDGGSEDSSRLKVWVGCPLLAKKAFPVVIREVCPVFVEKEFILNTPGV